MWSDALSREYQAARTSAGLVARDRGLIAVSGTDRATYLQGLLTNDVVALTPGHGCYAAYLTPQGRMITDLWVHELGDVMLLVLPRSTAERMLARLDQFIFSEDVQLGDVASSSGSFAVVGPHAARIVAHMIGVDVAEVTAVPPGGNHRFVIEDRPVILLHVTDAGEPGFELVVGREDLPRWMDAARAAGAVDVSATVAAALRIEAGVPLFGTDMDEDTIPLEAGIEERAVSFSKGCYVGQEVIIRVLHRGHGRVARRLVGVTLDPAADVPEPGTPLQADGKPVGQVTSSSWSPRLSRPVALAYVKRDVLESGTPLTTGTGAVVHVAPLPFPVS